MRGLMKHGHSTRIHGMTRVYRIWAGMISRCETPSSSAYKNYGARGIKVCERWHLFENFLADMGEPGSDQSIDRIDVNGDYCPENCRWETKKTQQRNTTRNVMIEYNGVTKCITDWAPEFGLKASTLYMRIRRGMSFDDAVKKKVGRWAK